MTLSPTIRTLTERYVEAGCTVPELPDLFGASVPKIRSRLRMYGLKAKRIRHKRPEKAQKRVDAMCEMYLKGHTLQEVGDRYGVSRERVRQLLVTEGITERRTWHVPKVKPVPLTAEQKLLRIRARFWARINITADPEQCWNWKTESKSIVPYPRTRTDSCKTDYAHRFAYERVFGKAEKWVLHRCNNPRCCNPNHLYDGTPTDNARDREANYKVNGKRRRLSNDDLRLIIARLAEGVAPASIAQILGVSIQTVYRIKQKPERAIRASKYSDDQIVAAFVMMNTATATEVERQTGIPLGTLDAIRQRRFRPDLTAQIPKIDRRRNTKPDLVKVIWSMRDKSLKEVEGVTGIKRVTISKIWNGWIANNITGLPSRRKKESFSLS